MIKPFLVKECLTIVNNLSGYYSVAIEYFLTAFIELLGSRFSYQCWILRIRTCTALDVIEGSHTMASVSEIPPPITRSIGRLAAKFNAWHSRWTDQKVTASLECGFWACDGRDARWAAKRSILELCFWGMELVRLDLFRSRFQSLIDLHFSFCSQLIWTCRSESTLQWSRNQRLTDSAIAILIPNQFLGHEILLRRFFFLEDTRSLSVVCSSTCIILSPMRSQLLIGTSKYDDQVILRISDLRHKVFHYDFITKSVALLLYSLSSARCIYYLVMSIALNTWRRCIRLKFTTVSHRSAPTPRQYIHFDIWNMLRKM